MTATGAIPRATHEGVLDLGPIKIACAVLADGTRVVSEREFIEALDRPRPGAREYERRDADAKSAGVFLPTYLAPRNLKPVIPPGFSLACIPFRAKDNNATSVGVEAGAIPQPLHGDQLALAEVTMSTQAPSSSRSAS